MPSLIEVRNEDAVERSTRVSRSELEDLGLCPVPTPPDYKGRKGWMVARRASDSALTGYHAEPCGRDSAIVTGRRG